mgnify:CR=1 FL=1
MRTDKLTHSLQAALGDAQSLAVGRDHPFIEPQHVLKAMVDPSGSAARSLLRAAGTRLDQLETLLSAALDRLPTVSGSEDVHVSQETQRLLNRADKLSQQTGDSYISTDSVLLAMLDSRPVAALITEAGVTSETLKAAGLVRSLKKPVKILAVGDVSEKFTVSAHKFSASAQSKIEAAGGSVTVIGTSSSDD